MRIIALLVVLIAPSALADKAVFAGGCFWCMEEAFEKIEGVTDVVSGFTGGTLPNPTYSGDHSGHFEAILVSYDSARVSYPELLEVYWRNVDPFDDRGQFCDKGFEYRAAIFVGGEDEARLARESRDKVAAQISRTERRHGYPQRRSLLAGRALPPGLLQEKPDPLSSLQEGVRPIITPRSDMGRGRMRYSSPIYRRPRSPGRVSRVFTRNRYGQSRR